jgi:phosphohistidine phosphatase
MKTLFLMRHAQAEWENPEISDYDRQLTEQGRLQAEQMAQRLYAQQTRLDVIYTSPAMRTLDTAKVMAEQFQIAEHHIIIEQQIYQAQVHDLLAVLAEIEETHENALIVGHNPSISDTVSYLCNQPSTRLPPAAIIGMQIDKPSWLTASHENNIAKQYLLLTSENQGS